MTVWRSYSDADFLQPMTRINELNKPAQQHDSVLVAKQLIMRMQELDKLNRRHSIISGKTQGCTKPNSISVLEHFRMELEDLDRIEEWCSQNKEMLRQLIKQCDHEAQSGHKGGHSDTSCSL